jgi:rRNA maturation protein Rpf1
MSITVTNHTLEKLELLLTIIGYKLRYEKGNFKTGTCLIEHNKMVVVNKFLNLEGKINALIELIKILEIDKSVFNDKQKQFYYSLLQKSITF